MSDFLHDEFKIDSLKAHAKTEKEKATAWLSGLPIEHQKRLWKLVGKEIGSVEPDRRILGQLAQLALLEIIRDILLTRENN